MKDKQVELFRSPENEETRRFVDVEITGRGELQMSGCDVGEKPMELWGDEDYEFFVTVDEEHKDWLLLYLLEDRYRGQESAVSEFKNWLKERGVPFRFWTYR